MEELNKQIELLKQYHISNYIIENNQIIINGDIRLKYHKIIERDFLKNVIINGYLCLDSLKDYHKDFLSGTIINGDLFLTSLTECHKDFLFNTTINGDLYLNYLKKIDTDFLKNAIITGYLVLSSLKEEERDILRSNVKKIPEGYNKEMNIIYSDGKISRVYSYYEKDNYIVYKTNNGTIHQRNIPTETGIISKFY